MKCPICKKAVSPSDAERPFCSERCRIIDLGNWASEAYVVSEPLDPETAFELELELEREHRPVRQRPS